MSFEIHTLYWKDSDPKFYFYHSKIMKKNDINIRYTNENINTGKWMDKIMSRSKSDIVGFIDIDCVVTNKQIVPKCIDFLKKNRSIIGIAQVSNHISPYNHIFVGPAFFFIHRQAWLDVGKPSFMQLKNKIKNFFKIKYDFAEGVCYRFEKKNIKYKALYPTHFDFPRDDYRLHNYGMYGVGTLYHGGVYHLYESRLSNNVNLFEKRCQEILNDNFDIKKMYSSIDSF